VKVNHPYPGFVLKTFLIYPTCLNACLRLKGMQRQLDVATKISSRINRQAVFQYAHRFQMQYSKNIELLPQPSLSDPVVPAVFL